MIKQIKGKVRLQINQIRYLQSIPKPNLASDWDRQDKVMQSIKLEINSQLEKLQDGYCSYCGLKLEETSRPEIDHIAPKHIALYCNFIFEPQNLALSCQFCNGSSKKHRYNPIIFFFYLYDHCNFEFVHPYFDDPDDHYEWVDESIRIMISDKSTKGKKSIEIFELDTIKQSEARSKELIYDQYVKKYNLSTQDQNRIKLSLF